MFGRAVEDIFAGKHVSSNCTASIEFNELVSGKELEQEHIPCRDADLLR